jgi:hypothetical protein
MKMAPICESQKYKSPPTTLIPQHYPIEAGVLFAGEYPGDRNPEIARARILSLVEMGVRTFIDLTSPNDPLVRYEGMLVEVEQEIGIPLRRISGPIPDMDVPDSDDTMLSIMAAIRASIEAVPAVYIHCWGGIGRTGTVVGCWLRECGHDPEAALAHVQHLYSSHMAKAKAGKYPESPQTEAQKNYVRRWNITGRPVLGAEVEFDRACVSPRAEGDES